MKERITNMNYRAYLTGYMSKESKDYPTLMKEFKNATPPPPPTITTPASNNKVAPLSTTTPLQPTTGTNAPAINSALAVNKTAPLSDPNFPIATANASIVANPVNDPSQLLADIKDKNKSSKPGLINA
jgi:hypothetical protein